MGMRRRRTRKRRHSHCISVKLDDVMEELSSGGKYTVRKAALHVVRYNTLFAPHSSRRIVRMVSILVLMVLPVVTALRIARLSSSLAFCVCGSRNHVLRALPPVPACTTVAAALAGRPCEAVETDPGKTLPHYALNCTPTLLCIHRGDDDISGVEQHIC